ncbi:hypothetical protein BP6252_04915 [Coleophoma cylindrospora]|uniref:Uncharacterized protein n=1 Tax=Coleophoma cylindrospora TaxID=1849047 RepID=A0A3D8S1V7_9HELO|nr:hypothetical protein BP6252_04915 [Coleophoma cylindrospora]
MAPKLTTLHLRPQKPFDAEYKLTLADNIPPGINSRYLFVYKAPDSQSGTADWQKKLVDRLSKSLESFLQEPEAGVLGLPQLLGKIYPDKDSGRLTLKVTKSSTVRFVVSHRTNVTYAQLRPDHGFPMRYLDGKSFATGLENIPSPDRSGGFEAFSAQITFIVGGFVICVNKHHFLLDANSTGKLIQWWFKKARSWGTFEEDKNLELADPSLALTIHDKSSLTMETTVPAQEHVDWKVVPNARPTIFGLELPPQAVMSIAKMLPFIKPKIDSAVFHFTSASLRQLHEDVSKHTQDKFSTHDAISALLWRCISRARLFSAANESPCENSMLALSVNGRRKLEPAMVDAYFGNAAFFAPTVVPLNILTSTGAATLADVTLSIRESINTKTTNAYLRSLLQLIAAQKRVTDVVNAFQVYMGYDVVMTSWEKLFGSIEDLDVGTGTFQRMRLPDGGSFDGLVMVMPAYGMRDECTPNQVGNYPGGVEVSIDLLFDHMASLKKDQEWTRYARWAEL